jgi:hypothetical protein
MKCDACDGSGSVYLIWQLFRCEVCKGTGGREVIPVGPDEWVFLDGSTTHHYDCKESAEMAAEVFLRNWGAQTPIGSRFPLQVMCLMEHLSVGDAISYYRSVTRDDVRLEPAREHYHGDTRLGDY